jgi:hypothetical protein
MTFVSPVLVSERVEIVELLCESGTVFQSSPLLRWIYAYDNSVTDIIGLCTSTSVIFESQALSS